MILVFSDLDGTLEDSRQDMAESIQSVRRLVFDLDPGDVQQWQGIVNRGMDYLYRNGFPELFEGLDQDEQSAVLEKIRYEYEREYYEHVSDNTVLYDGIREAYTSLAEHATLAVYTNKPQKITRRLLLELELSRQFEFIIGSDTFPESKPSPVPMQRVAEDSGFDASTGSAFMIGDTQGDMKAARAFGATAIWCAWGYHEDAPNDPAPDLIARHPRDLPGLVLEN